MSVRSVAFFTVVGLVTVGLLGGLTWLLFRGRAASASEVEGLVGVYLAVVGFLAGVIRWLWVRLARRRTVRGSTRHRDVRQVIARPLELDQLVTALCRRRSGTVAVTTGLHGAGGFGKTTLAHMALEDRRVQRRYGGEPVIVSIGEYVRGADLAAKINQMSFAVSDALPSELTDPDAAGQHLARLLKAGPRRVVFVDDVWAAEQLRPFGYGDHGCACLVTTRLPEALPGDAARIRVDQMTAVQAASMMTAGISGLPGPLVAELVAATGRWPKLIEIVNKQLRLALEDAQDIGAVARRYLDTRRASGTAELDVHNDADRDRAMADAVGDSLRFAPALPQDRFVELGVFAEDAAIPVELIAAMWAETCGMTEAETVELVTALHRRSLVSYRADRNTVEIHDVVRSYQRHALGVSRLAGMTSTLLSAAASRLPRDESGAVAWWEMPSKPSYMWYHVCRHLAQAGHQAECLRLVCDLRWVSARLISHGAAALAADLAVVPEGRAVSLRRAVMQSAHLLADTQPPQSIVSILLSRLQELSDWRDAVAAFAPDRPRPFLDNLWPRPDSPDPAMLRVLPGHEGPAHAVMFGPGGVIATSDDGGVVRVWDTASGILRQELGPHRGRARFAGFGKDDDTLLFTIDDRWMRVWDTATGRLRKRRCAPGLASMSEDWTIGPGNLVAVTDGGETVYLINAETVRLRNLREQLGGEGKLGEHPSGVKSMVFDADGQLAVGGGNGTIWIWDTATKTLRHKMTGHRRAPTVMAFGPDGILAAGDSEGSICLWDTIAGTLRRVIAGHIGAVMTLAFGPGATLATGGADGTVRLWDTTVTTTQRSLPGDANRVSLVAFAPDGTLAISTLSTSADLWDVRSGRIQRSPFELPLVAAALAFLPGGDLAASDHFGNVTVSDPATGHSRRAVSERPDSLQALTDIPGGFSERRDWSRFRVLFDDPSGKLHYARKDRAPAVREMAFGADGTYVTGDDRGTVRLWATGTSSLLSELDGFGRALQAIALGPGNTLATSDDSGTVRLHDSSTGMLRRELTGHQAMVLTIAFRADGLLATGDKSGTIRIWDTAAGTTVSMMRVDGPIHSIAWHNATLAVGGTAGCFLFTFHV